MDIDKDTGMRHFSVMSVRIIVVLGLVLGAVMVYADTNSAPALVSVDFAQVQIAGDRIELRESTDWIRDVRQVDGQLDVSLRAWVVGNDQAMGQGRLMIRLDRSKLPDDIALTLIYEETEGADFVVQLWDDENRIVALDLFSNIITAGRDAQTDTFIIPFALYPTATQIVLRRIKGDVRIYGFVLSPVACEVPAASCDEKELAIQLGGQLSPENPLVREANRIAQMQQKDLAWDTHTLQTFTPIWVTNEFAHSSLTDKAYPEYVPSATPVEGQVFFAVTATSLGFVGECLRRLNLYYASAFGEAPAMLTSADAETFLMDGAAPVCIMSVPMSTASRERFFRKRGYHLLEAPVALDAIQVLVNAENPLHEMTIPQLDAIFGVELRAGATQAIRTWGQLGLGGDWADKPIEVWGGSLAGGTTRIFQQLVLQGGAWRSDIAKGANYAEVVRAVAANRYALCFSNQQNHNPNAKVLALARNAGRTAYLPKPRPVYEGRYPLTRSLYVYVDAKSSDEINPVVREFLKLLLSHEGQAAVAGMGQIPLNLEQVNDARKRLGI